MRVIRSGNYSFTRVGHRCAVPRGAQLLPFYVPDGEIVVRWTGRGPTWATPAERAAHRATLPAQVLPAPPYPVLEDTQFGEGPRGPNFEQAVPHSPIFQVAPGVRLVFEAGRFVNCQLPDEVAPEDIGDVQNCQQKVIATRDPARPFVIGHAEDETTATFTRALQEEIASGRWKAHRRLGLVKAAARERRLDPAVRAADLDAIVAKNLELEGGR